MPDVAPPEELTAEKNVQAADISLDAGNQSAETDRSIELRPVKIGRYVDQKIKDDRIHIWIMTSAPHYIANQANVIGGFKTGRSSLVAAAVFSSS